MRGSERTPLPRISSLVRVPRGVQPRRFAGWARRVRLPLQHHAQHGRNPIAVGHRPAARQIVVDVMTPVHGLSSCARRGCALPRSSAPPRPRTMRQGKRDRVRPRARGPSASTTAGVALPGPVPHAAPVGHHLGGPNQEPPWCFPGCVENACVAERATRRAHSRGKLRSCESPWSPSSTSRTSEV